VMVAGPKSEGLWKPQIRSSNLRKTEARLSTSYAETGYGRRN